MDKSKPHSSLRKKQTVHTWKEPPRQRSLPRTLRAHTYYDSLSANAPTHSGLLLLSLLLLGGVLLRLSNGTFSTGEFLLISLASGLLIWLASLLPFLFSPARICIRPGHILRESAGLRQEWNLDEIHDMRILETYRNGERRELLAFRDSRGRRETILLPWRLDRSQIQAVLAAKPQEGT